MGWKTDLLEASFRGVTFAVEHVQDSVEKSVAVHEYPYRAGAEVEDLGRRARAVSVTALFWGKDYLDGVARLIEAFEETGPGEFIHPVFGSIQAAVRRYSVPHRAGEPDYVALDFELVEASLDNPFFDYQSARGAAELAESSLLSSVEHAIEEVSAAVREKLSPVLSWAQTAQATMQSYLAEAVSIYNTGSDFARSLLSYVTWPSAFVSDLLAAQANVLDDARGIRNTFSRAVAMSGALPFIGRSGMRIETASRRIPGSASGGRYVSGSSPGRAEAMLAIPLAQKARPAEPWPAPAPGEGTEEDVAVAAAVTLQTVQLARAVGEMFAEERENPTLTPAEVEAVVGDVRARVQASLDWQRASCPPERVHAVSESLRSVADAVQELGALLLENRPELVEYKADAEGNKHLLAHKLYGDYTRAQEILRLNPQIRNPNFIAKGQVLHVYAK